jgi:hypothetical protein
MTKKNAAADAAEETAHEEQHPTPEEAKALFKENPGLAAVVTTEGVKTREELL